MKLNLIEAQVALFHNDKAKLKELRRILGIRLTEVHQAITRVDKALKEVDDEG